MRRLRNLFKMCSLATSVSANNANVNLKNKKNLIKSIFTLNNCPRTNLTMPTVVENKPRDCTACRIVASIGLVGIGAYLANAAWKNKTLPGRIVISTISFAFVTLGVQRYKNQYPFNKNVEKT